MRSIKPGRGPSGMSFIGSVAAVIFGIFWTFMAVAMTADAPFPISIVFPLFGVIFVAIGIVQAMYHLRNATGKDRFSEFDITEESEETDPLNTWVHEKHQTFDQRNTASESGEERYNYCPGCGGKLNEEYSFCPHCGRRLHD